MSWYPQHLVTVEAENVRPGDVILTYGRRDEGLSSLGTALVVATEMAHEGSVRLVFIFCGSVEWQTAVFPLDAIVQVVPK